MQIIHIFCNTPNVRINYMLKFIFNFITKHNNILILDSVKYIAFELWIE